MANSAAQDAAILLIEAEGIREVARMFTGRSTENIWSPADLGPAIEQYAIRREERADSLLGRKKD